MAIIIDREDKMIEIARKKMFADNRGVKDLTTEGILEGFRKVEERPEIKTLNRMFKNYIDGLDEGDED
jgi:hypothetical protein